MKTIVDIKAGLGNQLFCYAFGYSVAKKAGSDLYIETSVLDRKKIRDRYLELLNFDLPYKKRISFFYTYNPLLKKLNINKISKRLAIGMNTKVFKEKEKEKFDEGVFAAKGDTYFDGYWQNYRYFDEYREEIQAAVRLKDSSEVRKYEEDIADSDSVSIHIRRGDYVQIGWGIPMDYYLKAIDMLKQKTGCSTLTAYVFSDDIAYAKEFFAQNPVEGISFKYMDFESERKTVLDMYLMSCCRHNIIANSTFSWWAAYLNRNEDKTVVCPETGKWTEEFYLPEWVKVKV